jgi:hypothetical protein
MRDIIVGGAASILVNTDRSGLRDAMRAACSSAGTLLGEGEGKGALSSPKERTSMQAFKKVALVVVAASFLAGALAGCGEKAADTKTAPKTEEKK